MRYKKQHDGFSCGPIALYNVLKKYGKTVNIKELARTMNTDSDGTHERDFTLAAYKWLNGKTKLARPKPWKGEESYLVSVTDYSGDSHLVALVASTEKSVFVANWYNSQNKFVHTWIPWVCLLKYWDGYALLVEGVNDW